MVKEDYNEEKDIRTTTVIIETENGAKTMGRPQGVYITLEAPQICLCRMRITTGKFQKNWQNI